MTPNERTEPDYKEAQDYDKSVLVVPLAKYRTLELSLAERTEERDEARAMYRVAFQSQVDNAKERDTALAKLAALEAEKANPETTWDDTVEINALKAKLAKCRTTLDKLHITCETSKPEIYDWYLTDQFASEARENALETLEETK